MVSDVLSEAIEEIDRSLRDMPEVYSGRIRNRLEELRTDMRSILVDLDTPPIERH